MPQTPKPYRWLAKYYDEIFAFFRSPMDRAREKLLRRIMPGVERACDLACGTGTTAVVLARGGVKVYGVDLSPEMCRIALEKARLSGLPIRILRADMRSFRLPEPVDLITCEFDALNHVPDKSDLREVAQSVAGALRAGGHFLFDVNNSLGFRKMWAGTVWLETPRAVLVMRNGHNRNADRAWSDVEWFIREGSLWRRRSERVEEVCWTADEIRQIFTTAGFDQVREWDATPFFKGNSLVTPGCRSIYLARRSGSEGC